MHLRSGRSISIPNTVKTIDEPVKIQHKSQKLKLSLDQCMPKKNVLRNGLQKWRHVLPTAQKKITYWHTETLFKHVLDNDIPNVEEVLEEIRKTNIAVNAVAKKFETP